MLFLFLLECADLIKTIHVDDAWGDVSDWDVNLSNQKPCNLLRIENDVHVELQYNSKKRLPRKNKNVLK